MPEKTQYDRVKEITDQLEAGIHDLFESDKYKEWLTTMSRFHEYSLNNTLLIAMQKPEATLVAGYTAWQKQFGRQVLKGEKGIRILAPAPYKEMVEMDKLDPDTRLPVLDENGDPLKEEQEVVRPAFKVVSVFDVSQTEGRELPTLGINELTGDVESYDIFLESLKRTCPVPIEFEDISSGAKGYFHQTENRIAIQEGMSQLQTIKTLVHEMAHQKLHSKENDLTRNSKEVEAESVAYTVCQHFGIDTSDYSFGYIAGWSEGKETPELKASLQTIRTAASEMISDIEGHFNELSIEKENDIEKEAEELAARLDDFGFDYDYYGYMDAVDDRELAVSQDKETLLSGEGLKGMIEFLQEVIDEVGLEEYTDRAKELIKDITEFEKKIGRDISKPEEKISDIEQVKEGTFIFDGDKYLDMHLTDDGSWDYTLYDKAFREIDGGQIGENYNFSIDDAKFEILKFHDYKDVFVMETDKEKFESYLDDLSSKTYTSDNQKEYIGDVILTGYDPKEYWIGGKAVDLTSRYFSDDELSDIKYQISVDSIPKMEYSPEQWKVIEKGISERLDVHAYADPSFNSDQMEMIRRGLIAEDKGYISHDDLVVITNTGNSADEMKQMLKEAMHTEPIMKEAVQQDNGMYRYYSTQRPAGPGTFPADKDHSETIHNFDDRIDIPSEGIKAWGYVEYPYQLSERQIRDYELKPATSVENRELSLKESTHERKSVLADLKAKQTFISGNQVPKKEMKNVKEEQL